MPRRTETRIEQARRVLLKPQRHLDAIELAQHLLDMAAEKEALRLRLLNLTVPMAWVGDAHSGTIYCNVSGCGFTEFIDSTEVMDKTAAHQETHAEARNLVKEPIDG